MSELNIQIEYVDGTSWGGVSSEWPKARADGVWEVRVSNDHWVSYHSFASLSVYWLYPEGDFWMVGHAAVGYRALDPELVFRGDGTFGSRKRKHMPDLAHSAVKLGWWKGTPEEAQPGKIRWP